MRRFGFTAAFLIFGNSLRAESGYRASPLLDFSLDPATIATACDAARARAERDYEAIADLPDNERTFENTILALDRAYARLSEGTNGPTFLKYSSPKKPVRDAGHECETKIEQYQVEVGMREDLYKAAKAFADSDAAKKLDEGQGRLLEKTMLAFRLNGLALPKEDREEVKRLKKELVKLGSEFGKNVNEVDDVLWVTEAELAGLPSDYIEKLEKGEDGRYKLTMTYPHVLPFLRNATDREARRKLEFMFSNRAAEKNVVLMENAISVRHQIAKKLGFRFHADFKLADRMAKDYETVQKFLADLIVKLRPSAEAELERMKKVKRKQDGSERFENWDWAFYNNWLKKNEYKVDDQKIKEYFPFEHVNKGMFEVYQTLFDVKFEQVKDAVLWHEDVKLFKVLEGKTGDLIGHFYMDLYPRDGKYKHAAAFSLLKRRILPNGTYRKPVSAVLANFDKPAPGKPSLMRHGEVETYFHEFGHVIHNVLSQGEYYAFSGTAVSRDFVEAPSQIFENWTWDPGVLKKISKHHKTGKPLSRRMIKRMLKAKNLNAGLRYLRQAFYASLDMHYHTREKVDTTKTYADMKRDISLIPMTPGTHPQASFGHLMVSGYDAGYYGYLWSSVYAQDMFSIFKKNGILDPKTGMRYRKIILEPGRMKEEMGQLIEFLGREPNPDAFVKSLGLKL